MARKRTEIIAGLSASIVAVTTLLSACTIPRAGTPGDDAILSLYDGMTYHRRTRELVIDFPVMDVQANLSYEHGGVTRTLITTAPFDASLHGYTIDVVDSAGRSLGRQYLHHMNILGPDQRELFSPIMIHIVASGMETRDVRTSNAVGYPIRKGERLALVAMLHNPTDSALRSVRIRARLPITVTANGRVPRDGYPFHLGVVEPSFPAEFDIPPGVSVQSRVARAPISGRIYALGGHLHRFGVSLKLEDVTAGRLMWEAKAAIDSAGNILSIPTRFPKSGMRVQAGHAYRVTSVYNNSSGALLLAGGMGAIGGVFIPDKGARWPVVDTTDAYYRRDFEMRFGQAAAHVHRHGGQ